MEMRIEELKFSTWAQNALLRNGIYTLEKLVMLDDKELLELHGLGATALQEIRQKVPVRQCLSEGKLVMGAWEPASQPPIIPGEYIVHIKDARKATVLHYGDEHWYDEDGYWYEVLYWMELPRLMRLPEVKT